jgi:phosphopantothenoylcysteine decarboxylase / phosphopantothenate---cysteine ligase
VKGRASWRGRKVLVTSGATREHLDPVRFLSNASSGRMGHALAAAARARGARVTLVTGAAEVPPPKGVRVVPVGSAREMLAACLKALPGMDAVVAAAAVGDFRPASPSARKIKKTGKPLTLKLVPNPDVIAAISARKKKGRPLTVGFALETHDLLDNAREKLAKKNLDLVVANGPESLRGETTKAMLLAKNGGVAFYTGAKTGLAERIFDVLGESL